MTGGRGESAPVNLRPVSLDAVIDWEQGSLSPHCLPQDLTRSSRETRLDPSDIILRLPHQTNAFFILKLCVPQRVLVYVLQFASPSHSPE